MYRRTDVCFYSTCDSSDLVAILLTVFFSTPQYPLEDLIYGFFFLYESLKIVWTHEIHSSLGKELQPYWTSQMTGKYYKIRIGDLFSPAQLQWHIQVF